MQCYLSLKGNTPGGNTALFLHPPLPLAAPKGTGRMSLIGASGRPWSWSGLCAELVVASGYFQEPHVGSGTAEVSTAGQFHGSASVLVGNLIHG